MCVRNKTLFFALIIFASCLGLSTQTQAQPDSAFDDIPLNGLASFVQLRKEYYVGGLYLESLNQDSGAIFSFSGRKRMELRITINEWSPRRFSQQWNQAILINNDQTALEEFASDILTFVDMPKEDLVAGDRITIDMDPNTGTTVYLNHQRMFRVKNNAFFDVLLNTWIGQRPPSSDFRDDILTLPTDQEGTDLLVRYEATIPTAEREKKVASWAPGEKNSAPKSATAASSTTASAAAPPPGSGTMVTAKRTKVDLPKPETPAVLAPPTAAAIAAPAMELEKPVLSAAPVEQTKTPAKSESKPAPKPAAKEVAKVQAAKPVAKEASSEPGDQEKLLQTYRSNALKLTYLNTQYPKRAMDFKQEGLVVLRLKISRKGTVEDITEESSSEHRLLNKAAREAVKKTDPYPEVPTSLKGDTVEITLPFNFRL